MKYMENSKENMYVDIVQGRAWGLNDPATTNTWQQGSQLLEEYTSNDWNNSI